HPAPPAAPVGAADLSPDLGDPEDPLVERIVLEVLQPRPDLDGETSRALPNQLDALVDDLVRVQDRIPEPGNPDVVARRVHHRADVIEVRRQLFDTLSDIGIVLVEGRVPEDVGSDEDAEGPELPAGPTKKARDRRQPRVLIVGPRVPGRRQAAVGGAADVVELDLVEALAGGFLGDGDVVGPHFFAERIDPGELLVVDPRLARARVRDGELGAVIGEHVVLERDDASDRVYAASLEVGDEAGEVLHVDRTLTRRPPRLDLRSIRNPPAVALDVDHDGVELRARDQI